MNSEIKNKDIIKNIISFLNITKKINPDYSIDIDAFILKIDKEGLSIENIKEMKNLTALIDNKYNTNKFIDRESKTNIKNVLNIINKKNISEKQKNIISRILKNIDTIKFNELFFNNLIDIFTDFSEELSQLRNKNIDNTEKKYNDFKEGTESILSGDISRASKTILRDVIRLSKQLLEVYPNDKKIQNITKEIKEINTNNTTHFFAVTDILTRLSIRSNYLQSNERKKSQDYFKELNSKLENVFFKLKDSSSYIEIDEKLNKVFEEKIKKEIKNINNNAIATNDISDLKSLIKENLNTLTEEFNNYSKKQNIIKKNQKNKINLLENEIQNSIKENKKLEKLLLNEKKESKIDNLTQLPNRKSYIERIKTEYNIWRKTNKNLCLIVLDIDNFKYINDSFGHNVGDKALRNVAALIKDFLCNKLFFSRIGGEEFVLICPNISIENASLISNKIRKKVENRIFLVGEQKINITCSFGVSKFNSKNDTIETVFNNADKALYKAKSAGRNRVFTFDENNIINTTK